jgi:hypothetical protein
VADAASVNSRERVPLPRIGCSGWNYKDWRGEFYPERLPHHAWLQYYASVFDTVEINNTFYRLPEGSTFKAWREQLIGSGLKAYKAQALSPPLREP